MSDVPLGSSEELRRLRVLRLLQVREQSKTIAKKIRDRVLEEKYKQDSQILAERRSQIQKEKEELQKLYELRLSTIGEGHNLAVAEEESKNEWIKEFNIKRNRDSIKALERSKAAVASFRKEKTPIKNSELKRKNSFPAPRFRVPSESGQIKKKQNAIKASLEKAPLKKAPLKYRISEPKSDEKDADPDGEFISDSENETFFTIPQSKEKRLSSIDEEHDPVLVEKSESTKKSQDSIKVLKEARASKESFRKPSTESAASKIRSSLRKSSDKDVSPPCEREHYNEEKETRASKESIRKPSTESAASKIRSSLRKSSDKDASPPYEREHYNEEKETRASKESIRKPSTESAASKIRSSLRKSSEKDASPPCEFEQYYEEKEMHHCCDSSNIVNEITTQEKKVSNDSMSASSFPVKDGSSKLHLDIIDSPTPLESQLSIADIEKALCDCEPRLKNVVSNVHSLLRNNVKCDPILSQDINDNIRTSSSDSVGRRPRISKARSAWKKVEFVPFTIISDYLKTCNKYEYGHIDDDGPEDEKNPDGAISSEQSSPLRKYSESEFSDVRRTGPPVNVDYRNIKNVGFAETVNPEIEKENSDKNLGKRKVFSTKKIISSSSSSEKVSPKNILGSKNGQTKPTIVCVPSISNRKYRSPFNNKRIVKCYDYNNKFSKKVFINDDDMVERMSKKKVNAFQSAAEETEERNAIEKSLEITKSRLNQLSRMRGEKALEKIKIEEDYKKLLEELEFLTKREQSVSGNRDKIFREKVQIHDDGFNQQRHANAPTTEILDDHNEFDIITSKFTATKSKSKLEGSTNVAHWDVCSGTSSKSTQDKQTNDSESSVKSIIVEEKVNTSINRKQGTEDIELVKSHKTKNKDKISSKKTKKSLKTDSDNVDRKIIPVQFIKNTKSLPTDLKNTKSVVNCVESQIISSSSASSITTFEGIEIRIEMKKPKKGSAAKKVSETKNKEVQTAASEFESSSEISITASKIETRKNEIVTKKNNSVRFDSDSTAYMSPPEKCACIKYTKKISGTSNSKPKNTVTIDKLDKSVNTDHSINKITISDNIPSSNTNSQELQITPKTNKSPHVSCVSSDYSINRPKDDNGQVSYRNLESYIKRLLAMSNSELNLLNVDVSEVATPNSSVINMSSNLKFSDSTDNKIDQVHLTIKETHEMLDQFKKVYSSSDERVYMKGKNNQLDKFSSGSSVSSNKSIKNDKKSKERQKIEDRIETHDFEDLYPVRNINIAEESPLSAKSIKSNPEAATIFDDKENLHHPKSKSDTIIECIKSDETLDELSAEHTKRILNFSRKLDQLRREKYLPSTSNNMGEDLLKSREIPKVTEFIPILCDIPKPNSQNNLNFDHQPNDVIEENPSGFYESNPNFTPNKEFLTNYPHNLSTIIEVDTPGTNKNSSTMLKNVDIDIEALRESLINISDDKTDNEVSSILGSHTNRTLKPPSLENVIDVNIEPFVSLNRFVHRETNGKEEKISASNEFSTNSSMEETISGMSEFIAANKSLLKKSQSAHYFEKQFKNCEVSGVYQMDSSSGSLTPELENLIKSFGPESMTTWKKTREAQALSSSSSSSSTRLDITKDILSKLIDVTVTTVGLSSLHDDLDLSDEHQKQFNVLTNSLLNQKLDSLVKNSARKSDLKKRAAEEASIIVNLLKNKENIKDSINCTQSAETGEHQSNDKTQHRTSTPVQLSKMSSTSKTATQNSSKTTSHYIFSVDSDLSSVRNVSASLPSDDYLSVPNISLKFGNLFDSGSSLQSDKLQL